MCRPKPHPLEGDVAAVAAQRGRAAWWRRYERLRLEQLNRTNELLLEGNQTTGAITARAVGTIALVPPQLIRLHVESWKVARIGQ